MTITTQSSKEKKWKYINIRLFSTWIGVKWSKSRVQLFVIPWTIQSMEFSRPEYWSGCLSLLQGIFPTQRWNPGLPHCRQILYQLSHKVSPRILEWVAYPFSRGFSRPRKWTGVSSIIGGFFINWAVRKTPFLPKLYQSFGGFISH